MINDGYCAMLEALSDPKFPVNVSVLVCQIRHNYRGRQKVGDYLAKQVLANCLRPSGLQFRVLLNEWFKEMREVIGPICFIMSVGCLAEGHNYVASLSFGGHVDRSGDSEISR